MSMSTCKVRTHRALAGAFARLPRLTSTCTRATQGSEICPEHSCASIRHVCGCLACLNALLERMSFCMLQPITTSGVIKCIGKTRTIPCKQKLTWFYCRNHGRCCSSMFRRICKKKQSVWQREKKWIQEFSKMLSIVALAKHNIWCAASCCCSVHAQSTLKIYVRVRVRHLSQG